MWDDIKKQIEKYFIELITKELNDQNLWFKMKDGINSSFFNEFIILPIMENINNYTEKYTKYVKIAFSIQLLIMVLLIINIIICLNLIK